MGILLKNARMVVTAEIPIKRPAYITKLKEKTRFNRLQKIKIKKNQLNQQN